MVIRFAYLTFTSLVFPTVEQLTLLTLDHQTALPTAPPTAAPTAPSQSSGEHPPLPHRRESAEAKSASLGRNAYLQVSVI